MEIPIDNLGEHGIIKGVEAYSLPPNAWTDGNNVRFTNGRVIQAGEDQSVFGTTMQAAYALFPFVDGDTPWWIYPGASAVYATNGTTHYDISRAAGYSANQVVGWNGGSLGGIPIINNGIDLPQMWTPVTGGQILQDLANWPSAWRAKVVRPFLNYLVALDMQESGTDYPYSVRWSAATTQGAVPVSWDENDDAYDAGFTELQDSDDLLVDFVALSNFGVIYKEQRCYRMQYVGGAKVFDIQPAIDVGLLARRCAIELQGRHIVVTTDDVVIHDTLNSESIIESKWRRQLFRTLNVDALYNMFLVHNKRASEVWICYPEIGQTLATRAVIFNTKYQTWSTRDLPGISAMGYGIVDSGVVDDTWDADEGVWDHDLSVWDTGGYDATRRRMLMMEPTTPSLMLADSDDALKACRIRREGLFLGATTRTLMRVAPVCSSGRPITIAVGYEDRAQGGYKWLSPTTFTPGVDEFIEPRISGRSFAIEYQAPADAAFELSAQVFDFANTQGRR